MNVTASIAQYDPRAVILDSALIQKGLIEAFGARQHPQQAKNGTHVYTVIVAMLSHAGAT